MKRIALLALGTCLAGVASAGVYVETVDHNLSTGKTTLAQKMYVQGGSGRFVDEEGKATIVKNGNLYFVDDKDKSYVVFDKATMQKLAARMNAAAEQAKEQLAKMPPEQRAQVEKMMAQHNMPGMGGESRHVVEVIDTGKSDKVDGRPCKLWDVKRNGELDEQICVVPYSALPGKENFQQVFASFAKAFEEMAKSVPMLAGMMTNEFDAQAKVNGYPVRSRDYENGRLVNEETVLKVWREEAIPASLFEVPAGYKQKTMDDMGN
jgi:hypothetical protein